MYGTGELMIQMGWQWSGIGLKNRVFAPILPFKTLLLVNLLTFITIFFNKIRFVNKNILEITNKFIPSYQTNF